MKKKTSKDLLGPEWRRRHERTQRMLRERIAYHEAKLKEERAAGGDEASAGQQPA